MVYTHIFVGMYILHIPVTGSVNIILDGMLVCTPVLTPTIVVYAVFSSKPVKIAKLLLVVIGSICLFLRALVSIISVIVTVYSGNPRASNSVNGFQLILTDVELNRSDVTFSGVLDGGSSSLKKTSGSFSSPLPALVNATTTTSYGTPESITAKVQIYFINPFMQSVCTYCYVGKNIKVKYTIYD